MAEQTTHSSAPLRDEDFASLVITLDRVLDGWDAAHIPDCLGHRDPNPGNFLVGESCCRILDWAEAYIGPPFFTFEYFQQYHERQFRDATAFTDLKTAYYSKWICGFQRRSLVLATSASPLLAVFAYGAADEQWATPEIYHSHEKAAYYRSLTRRMWRLSLSMSNAAHSIA